MLFASSSAQPKWSQTLGVDGGGGEYSLDGETCCARFEGEENSDVGRVFGRPGRCQSALMITACHAQFSDTNVHESPTTKARHRNYTAVCTDRTAMSAVSAAVF